jgi:hypothetical protein
MVDPMTVRLETSMVRHQSDVVRRDIRMSSGHPMAVGSDVRVGRVGWVTDILWISVCYQGLILFVSFIPEGNILVYSEGSKVKCPKIVYKGEEHGLVAICPINQPAYFSVILYFFK